MYQKGPEIVIPVQIWSNVTYAFETKYAQWARPAKKFGIGIVAWDEHSIVILEGSKKLLVPKTTN